MLTECTTVGMKSNHLFKGIHILAEFYEVLNYTADVNQSFLRLCIEECCNKAHVTLLKFDYIAFDNGGYTAFALLAESHISIHTYPEYQSVFLDVFTCGNGDTGAIIDTLEEFYRPVDKKIQVIERGKDNTIK